MATKASRTPVKPTKDSPAAARARPKRGSRSQRRTSREKARPQDAIQLLKADHREVEGWFKQFENTEDDAAKQDLADRICQALIVHTQVEEEILYPAAYDAFDEEGDDMVDEAQVEHSSAKALIAEIQEMEAGQPLFDAKVKVLGEYIDHHVKEEESELFPECRSAGMDLKALGEAIAARKAELLAEISAR